MTFEEIEKRGGQWYGIDENGDDVPIDINAINSSELSTDSLRTEYADTGTLDSDRVQSETANINKVSTDQSETQLVDDAIGTSAPNVDWVRDEISGQLASQDTIIEDFEDVSLDNYTGDLASFEITDEDATTGFFSLNALAEDYVERIVATEGLDAVAPRGCVIAADVYIVSLTSRQGFIFGASGYNNYYAARVVNNTLEIVSTVDDTQTTIASEDFTTPTGEWLTWYIEFGDETIRWHLVDEYGAHLSTVEVGDTTHDGYGIGFYWASANSHDGRYDNIRRTTLPDIIEQSTIDTDYDGGGGVEI